MKKIFIVLAAFFINLPVYASDISSMPEIEIGSSRYEVHEIMGSGEIKAEGLKEIYGLGGETKAVLHYDEDMLVRGYILNN